VYYNKYPPTKTYHVHSTTLYCKLQMRRYKRTLLFDIKYSQRIFQTVWQFRTTWHILTTIPKGYPTITPFKHLDVSMLWVKSFIFCWYRCHFSSQYTHTDSQSMYKIVIPNTCGRSSTSRTTTNNAATLTPWITHSGLTRENYAVASINDPW
jgi:hypothetical protein